MVGGHDLKSTEDAVDTLFVVETIWEHLLANLPPPEAVGGDLRAPLLEGPAAGHLHPQER
eukprot:11661182-Alexandrium_andersonii.AAC.1